MKEYDSNYDINFRSFPVHILGYVVGAIGSCITIYLLIVELDGLYRLIALLVLAIIILITYLLYNIYHLKRINRINNNTKEKMSEISDNRDTLDKMVDEKNIQIEYLKENNVKLSAQVNLMYYLLQQNGVSNTEVIKQALEIDSKGVINSDQVIEDSKDT